MTMSSPAADLAGRLAENAEAVCRYYLSNGRRQGRYWIVGDVMNSRGGSRPRASMWRSRHLTPRRSTRATISGV